MKKIFIILLLFLLPIFVSANERVDVKIEYIPNVYWNYYRNGSLCSGQLAYIYVGDKIGYGINIREELNSSSYVRLSEEFTDRHIITMAYFGYGYNGENTLKDYMATQKLIWKSANSEEVYFTTEINSGGTLINIDEYIDKIYDRYNNYAKFPNYGINVKYLLGTSSIKNTKVTVSTPLKVVNTTANNISLDENGNIVFIANEIGNNIFTLETNYKIKSPNYKYISTGAQPIVTIGSSNVSREKYYYEVIAGSININVKFDKNINEKITNNKFELYDSKDKLIGVYIPNEEGNILINNLGAGKYKLKHTDISDGYNAEEKEYIFEINNSNININKEIILKLKTSKISISRTYGNIVLNDINYDSNINYIIYDDNNNYINEVKTDEKGYVEFNLDYGNYKIIESNTRNIKKNSNEILIDKTMFDNDNHYDIHNYEYKTNVKVITLNKETKEKINNVNFTFNGNIYATNEKGIFIIKDIVFDKLIFSEINKNGFKKINSNIYEINEYSEFYVDDNEPYTNIELYLEKVEEKKEIEEIKKENIEKEPNVNKENDSSISNEIKDIQVEKDFLDEKKDNVPNIEYNVKEEVNIEIDKEIKDDINETNIEKLPFLGDNNINEDNKIIYYICNFIKFNWMYNL